MKGPHSGWHCIVADVVYLDDCLVAVVVVVFVSLSCNSNERGTLGI